MSLEREKDGLHFLESGLETLTPSFFRNYL
jgi:hypothetical protein